MMGEALYTLHSKVSKVKGASFSMLFQGLDSQPNRGALKEETS